VAFLLHLSYETIIHLVDRDVCEIQPTYLPQSFFKSCFYLLRSLKHSYYAVGQHGTISWRFCCCTAWYVSWSFCTVLHGTMMYWRFM